LGGRAERGNKLTAVRIIHGIIGDVDGASVELAFGGYIRNAARDLRPQRLTGGVTREQSGRLPHRWEVVDVLGRGRVVILRAFQVWVCGAASQVRRERGQRRKRRTRDLRLGRLVCVVLGEGRRCYGSKGGDEFKRA
jgi:hypothetical protein